MRIGIDGRLWNETGVGRYIRNLVKHLQTLDKKNEYVLFVKDRIQNSEFRIQNWKLVVTDIRWHTIEEQVRLPSILEKEQLDLVHFPYFSVPYFYSRPFVVTIHDLIPFHFNTGLATTLPLPLYKAKRLGYKLVLRQTVKKARKIIAVSNATKQEVVRYLGVEPLKVAVMYEGVDEHIAYRKSHIVKDNKQYAMSDKQYFLYVGNAYPHKNLERLIEAHNILSSSERKLGLISQYPNISIIFVGKEDYFYKRLKEKVKEMGLSTNVTFYGQATDEELVELYRNAKGLIIPSLMEGFGLTALEAMANNCLVLASDIPSLRETCGEAAIYFNPYDADDIANKMQQPLLSDLNHFTQHVARGLVRAKGFSWKKMAQQTLKVYKQVCKTSFYEEAASSK